MVAQILRAGCPVCSGTGRASYLRSGAWLNEHCPGKNGPLDIDSAPMTHALDNLVAQRKVIIEYKRPGEEVGIGQELHFSAELRSTALPWLLTLILVRDNGQTRPADPVNFDWRTNSDRDRPWRSADTDTIDNLARRITGWLWPA